MSNHSTFSQGRFTASFTNVPAGAVQVAGVPPGAAGGGPGMGNNAISSIASFVSVSPDTAQLLPRRPSAKIFQFPAAPVIPPRPATRFAEAVQDWLSVGD